MFYNIKEYLNIYPYYNRHVNVFRAGMWSMVIGITFVNLFAIIFNKIKLIFGILMFIVAGISFFVGAGYCIFKYKKQTQNIYRRFKAKKIEDKIRYKYMKGIKNETISSKSSNDNEDHLISVDSYNSDSEKEGSHEEGSHNNNEYDNDGNESSDYDNESDYAISDRISERITSFGSLTEIGNFYF